MGTHDPKGFYKALNISPTASQTEIRLAYKFLKRAFKDGKRLTNIGKIQSAYQTLSDPKLRVQYDGHAHGRPHSVQAARRASRLHSIHLLVAATALCLAAMAIAFGPAITAGWASFNPGEQLVWKQTSQPLGEILSYEESHQFQEAPAQAAYEVKLGSGLVQWFAATDLHRGAIKR
jgi:DnaJ-class molecular chaperone